MGLSKLGFNLCHFPYDHASLHKCDAQLDYTRRYMIGFRGIGTFSTEELNKETEKVFLRVRVTTITSRSSFITDICPFPDFLGRENVTFLHKHILSQSVMLNQCI